MLIALFISCAPVGYCLFGPCRDCVAIRLMLAIFKKLSLRAKPKPFYGLNSWEKNRKR